VVNVVFEVLDPNYWRTLQEALLTLTNTLQNITRTGFDDASRIRSRVEYLDDGWIRVRVDGGSALDINLVEVLREFSWIFYNIAELNSALNRAIGTVGGPPPSGGVVLLGFDGNVLRSVKTNVDGRLQVDVITTANPPNLNIDMLSVRRTIQSLMPSTGRYASIPPDDYAHWVDPAEYSVTETTWAEKTRCIVKPRNLPTRTYILYIRVWGRVDTAGQLLSVRIRSHYKGVLCTFTFTETSYVCLECRATYVAPGWWDDPLYVEAYVTGGTGYVKDVQINFVRANVIEGWTYTLGSGEHFKPVRVTEDGKLLAVLG